MSWSRTIQVVLSCSLIASCGDDASEAPASDAQVDGDAQPTGDASGGDGDGDAAERLRRAIGTFAIELNAPVPATDTADERPGNTSIVGRVYAAAPPNGMQWTKIADEADCQLFEPFNPFCDPAYGSGTTCVDDGTCVAPPASLDLGTITLTGLGDEALSIDPLPPSNTYQPRSTSALMYPPFAENDVVTLSAEGGELLPFELSAAAIAPLELISPSPLPFDPEAETLVRWTPPASGDSSRIIVTVDISHHGGRKGEIVCETDDDGELELPATLVQGLIDLGVAGFPTVSVTRESTRESLPAAPGIELRIFSNVDRELDIPGVTSCEEPGQQDVCPEGQICQANKLCR